MFPGADVKSGSIFCFECRDFIYDAKVDELFLASVVSAEEQETRFQGSLVHVSLGNLIDRWFAVSKNHRERFQQWVPTTQDAEALENAVAIPCQGELNIHAHFLVAYFSRRPPRIIEPRADLLHERRSSVLYSQSTPPQLFPRR